MNHPSSPRQQADSNLVILSLPYSFLVDSVKWPYETKSGLWQDQFNWSKALVPYSILSHHQLDSIRIIDNIGRLRETVMALNYNGVSETNHIKLIEPQLNNRLIIVSINGIETFINNCRSELLGTYNHVTFKKISLSDTSFRAIGANFILALNCIAARYGVEVVIGPYETDFMSNTIPSKINNLYVLGNTQNLCLAETDIRVCIDTLLDGCYVDKMTIPLSIVPTLGGVKMANFSELTRESNVNVYLPYMAPSLRALASLTTNSDMAIWFSSKQASEVLLSKKILSDLRNGVDPELNENAKLYMQEIKVCKEKMDLLSLYHRPELLSIMFKHGTFLQMPELGDLQDDLVIVQGSTIEALNDTMAEFAALCSKFYTLELSFQKVNSFPPDLEYFLISLVSLKRSCILSFNEFGLRFVGGKTEIHALLSELTSDLNRNMLFSKLIARVDFKVLVSMELANDQKDFVSGKKNGKIIKILNQVNQIPSIAFESFSSLNFLITLSIYHCANQDSAMPLKLNILAQTVKLLELELPAEQKFNIPEAFHKSIIGNGGQVIQAIMKKYNVFIKFISFTQDNKKGVSAVRERSKNLYSLQRSENVIIKCPMKNLKNIEFAKYEIDQLVKQCCQNSIMSSYGTSVVYNTVQFELLRSHYQLLIRNKNYDMGFISDLEREYGTYIAFPKSIEEFKGESSIAVMIKGNDLKARLCAQQLESLLPKTKEFLVKYDPEKFQFAFTENKEMFRANISIPFRLLLESELIVIPHDPTVHHERSHILSLSSYSALNLAAASVQLEQYLLSQDLVITEEKNAKFNPIISIEECVSPKKQSYGNKLPTKRSGLSPVKGCHGRSFDKKDAMNLAPILFELPTKETKKMTRKKSTSPLQPITNQPLGGLLNKTLNVPQRGVLNLASPIRF